MSFLQSPLKLRIGMAAFGSQWGSATPTHTMTLRLPLTSCAGRSPTGLSREQNAGLFLLWPLGSMCRCGIVTPVKLNHLATDPLFFQETRTSDAALTEGLL